MKSAAANASSEREVKGRKAREGPKPRDGEEAGIAGTLVVLADRGNFDASAIFPWPVVLPTESSFSFLFIFSSFSRLSVARRAGGVENG